MAEPLGLQFMDVFCRGSPAVISRDPRVHHDRINIAGFYSLRTVYCRATGPCVFPFSLFGDYLIPHTLCRLSTVHSALQTSV